MKLILFTIIRSIIVLLLGAGAAVAGTKIYKKKHENRYVNGILRRRA